MKLPLPASTLPTLALSCEDERRLERAAEAVVKGAVQHYYEHLTVHNGVVDKTRWKKIKQREDVRVYREHKSSIDEATAANSSSSASTLSEETTSESGEFKTLAPMLTFGSIQGNLDDIMYGALNPSVKDMQLKSAYVGDGFVDWALLASIIKPSEKDPFRELSVKWTIKGFPRLIGTIVRTRDTLYIESIGIAFTPSGERIGYHLQHSIDIPEVPELTQLQIVRAKISFCHLFRQRKENCVEVYIRGFISPMGDVPPSLAAVTSAEVSVSVWKNLHCAEMKKLTRMLGEVTQLQNTGSSSRKTNTRDSSYSMSGSLDPEPTSTIASVAAAAATNTCTLCSQSLGGVLSFTSSKEKHCRICSANVCSRCRVHKSVHLPTSREKEICTTSMAFCTRCMLDASCASSAAFAALDALAAEGEVVDYTAALSKHSPER